MPFNQLLSAAVEQIINRLLQLDETASSRLKPLDGKVVAVQLQSLGPLLYCVCSSRRVDVLAGYEGTPDAIIRVQLSALGRLRDSSQITAVIKQGELEIEGNLQVAQHFSRLLTELDIDAEEQLSRYTGDILAHQAFRALRLMALLLRDRLQLVQANLGEYIREEARLAPGPLEVMQFSDAVDDLRDAVARIEVRIKRLSEEPRR